MVLLVGFEGDKNNLKGFYYHDPDAETVESGKNLVFLLRHSKNIGGRWQYLQTKD